MKKITLPDFERNHVKKTNRWLGWLSFCLIALLGSFSTTYGQGNTCIAPLTITNLPYTLSGDTASYGDDYETANIPPVATGAIVTGTSYTYYLNGDDVVFTITPSINGTMTVNTSFTATYGGVFVFTGCPFTSTLGYNVSSATGVKEITNLPVIANTTYYIVISTWAAPQSSAFTLNITGTPGLLTPPEACVGTPVGGTASLTPNTGNATAVFTANATGVTLASGLTYQWQKNIAGTWQDIAGATSLSSQITAETGAVGTVTDYRLAVTCTASAETVYSTTASYTISLTYCVPTVSANNADEIRNFTLSNLNNSSAASEGVAGYMNYAGTVAPAQLSIGVPYVASLTGGTGSGNHGAAIWIDYNQNGTFEASEKVSFIGNTIGASATASFPEFIVPNGTPLGIYRLRVQHHYNVSGETLNPCVAASQFSETEDYNVEVFPTPTCLQPSGLTASNLTGNSAQLSWTSTGSLFNIEWGTQGFVQGTGTTVNGVTFPYTLNTLLPNTSYSYYVRTDCGATDGLSLWSGPYTFKTPCVSVTGFFENFDTSLTGTTAPMPDCWSKAGNGTTYITTGSLAPNSPANRLYMIANGVATTPTQGFAITPALSNLQANTHRLKFKAYATTTDKTMEIGYFTNVLDISTFVTLETFVLPGTLITTQEFIVEPSGIPAGVTNLVFRNNAPTASTTIYIDDVAWESLPLCVDIISIQTQTFNSTSATITWDQGGAELGWEYVYAVSTVTDPNTLTPVAVSGNPIAMLTGLTPNTTYKIWVRSNCGPGALGNWQQNPHTFTTSCTPVATFTENFDSYTATGATNPLPNCWTRTGNTGSSYITTGSATPLTPPNRLYLSGSATTSTNGVAVMPPVSNLQAETHRLKFKGFCTTAGKSIEIGYFELAGDASSFIVLETFEMPSTVIANATEFIYTPEFIPDGIESIAFRVNGGAFTATTTMYIDDVVWEPIPSCPDLVEFELSNITASTIDVLWIPGGSETAWQYVYAVSTVTDPSTLTPASVNNNPYLSLSDLTPSTNYNLWIRSDCGSGIFGNWSTPQTFTTACAIVTYFSENFDTSATGATNPLPSCWSRLGNGSTYVTTGGVLPGTPPNRLYMFANGTATTPTESIAVMPPVSNLAAGTHRLKFKAYASAADKTVEIGYFGDPSDVTTYVALQVINLTTTTAATAAIYTYIPSDIPSGITSLAFKNAGLPASTTLYIDDVVWEPQPLCPDVNLVSFIGATSNTASISWTPGGSETAWEYVYALATVTDPTTLTPYPVTGSPQAVISGLLPSTTYKVWVRSTCGTDLGAFSSSTTFITACEAITTLPWNEGFEGITTVGTTAFPPCWFKENGDWATALTSTYNTPKSGTKYLRDSWSATNEYMWTPGFELTAGTSYDFSFFMQGDGHVGWAVDVFYNTVQNSVNATQIGNTNVPSGAGSTAMQPYSFVYNTFVPTTTGVYYFAVRVNQPSGTPWYVAFDDFKVEASPSCVQPITQPATNVTSATATINWNPSSSLPVNGYDYLVTTDLALVPSDTSTPSGTVAAGITSANIIGLTGSTTYKYFVRALCSASDKSSWSSAGTFVTPCVAISTLPWNEGFENVTTVGTTAFPPCWFKENGDWATANAVTYNTPRTGTKYLRDSYAAANEYMWTPGFEMTAGTSYDFSFYMQGDGYSGWDVDVFYNTVQSSVNATQLGGTTTATGPGSSYVIQPYQFVNNTFVPTTTGVYYFAVRVNQPGFPWYVAFDDFKLDLSPNCVTPITPTVTNITTTTATINWTAPFNAPASGYDYYVTTSTVAPTAATTPTGSVAAGITTANLTDLTTSTAYKFYVRGVCSTTETSEWSQGGTFTTLCDAAPLPYTINFESVTVPNLPLCTSNQNVGTGNNWVTANNPGSGFTNKTLRYIYNVDNAANTWFYTNRVSLVAGTQYSVTYKYGANSTATYFENMKVAYGVSATSTDMTNILATHTAILGNVPFNNTVTFTPAVSGTYVIGFNAYSAADQNSLFLDDIVIQEFLGTVDFNNNKFTVYPNPVKDNLNIRYNENISNVSVFNMLGQQVITKNINATEGKVDMSNLASGTYLVKVNSGDKVETIKVIKE